MLVVVASVHIECRLGHGAGTYVEYVGQALSAAAASSARSGGTVTASVPDEIIRNGSWLFLFVGQFFASVIWVVMPLLVGRTIPDPVEGSRATGFSGNSRNRDHPKRPV